MAKGQERILLVMATGTGKTYTAFQIIWRLWKSNWRQHRHKFVGNEFGHPQDAQRVNTKEGVYQKRVLFLADQ
ncbi:DEAD/DEAH box helicase family protein [Methylomonas koyamae]|nr:DEAD/DEAH box helicase family protein [Methylomonas koyamae]WNB78147.1 DEAD/DEAH box helicase family protein [Methylomonas koyamae]